MPGSEFYSVIIRKLGQLKRCNLALLILRNCEESYHSDDLIITSLNNSLINSPCRFSWFGNCIAISCIGPNSTIFFSFMMLYPVFFVFILL